jgi:hypothetical protein
MATETEPLSVSATVRATIRSSGLPLPELALRSGVTGSLLWRFLHQGDGLPLSSLDALCRTLGLELRPTYSTFRERLERERLARQAGDQ